MKYYGLSEEKISHLPIFFDAANINVTLENDGYILFVGRLDHQKGSRTLLKAVEKDPSINLKIVADGILENELRKMVEEKRLKVDFLGLQSFEKLQDLIRRANFIVVPSEWYDNSPNIILEAYAHGKPVIGANIGGIPELIINGETGYLFEPRNHEDLLDKIKRLMRNSKELGLNGRKYLDEVLNPDDHYQKLIEIYNKVIAK